MNEIIPVSNNKNGYGQVLFRFDNGYGASVIRNPISYGNEAGLFELAVIEWNNEDWKFVYDTPITNDVIGFLTGEEVEEILKQIRDLTKMLDSSKIDTDKKELE